MIEPCKCDIGRQVVYRRMIGDGRYRYEQGEITSFNDSFVFVRYGPGSTSAATRRQDLEWAHNGKAA